MSLREYLVANMFDGQEPGRVTMDGAVLLDDIVENVLLFLIGDNERTSDKLLDYFGAGPAWTLERVADSNRQDAE